MAEVVNKFIEDYGVKDNEKKDFYVKRVDAENKDNDRTGVSWRLEYWELDKSDLEDLKSDFDNIKNKNNEKYKEIKTKITDLKFKTEKTWNLWERTKSYFWKAESFNGDFYELWKMISWLKKDLIDKKNYKRKNSKESVTVWLSGVENKEWNNLLKLKPVEINNFYTLKKGDKIKDFSIEEKKKVLENYKLSKKYNEDEKINKPLDEALEKNPIWEAIIWVFWKDVLKNLLNNWIIWKFLKWILNIFQDPKLDFNFSNKAEKLIWNVDWTILKEWDFKKITKEKWLQNVNKILENGEKLFWKQDKNVKNFYDEVTKYDNWILDYIWDSSSVVWDRLMRSKIQTKDIKSAMFIKKEMNSEVDSKFDFKLWWVLTKVMDWKTGEIWWDFTKQFENLKDVFKNKDVIRTVELDENNKTQLKVTFVKKEDFMEKVKEVWKNQVKKLEKK